jgi:hypothetical protein
LAEEDSEGVKATAVDGDGRVFLDVVEGGENARYVTGLEVIIDV